MYYEFENSRCKVKIEDGKIEITVTRTIPAGTVISEEIPKLKTLKDKVKTILKEEGPELAGELLAKAVKSFLSKRK